MNVKINNNLDPICNLYYNGKFVGIIKSNTTLMDICAQIKQNQEKGYTVRYNKIDYPIEIDGRIKNTPKGFYDSEDKSMRIIMGF